ncbi:fatty acid desaturase [Cystobacter fuscus]|uniref:Fatty acid desaturase n=1 Tax=Cystobacter fuscus TaxID=43 RepID=A0A250J9R1_9BACT|nr:fatty acid desaturase [Cystobacter fuscus]ATB40298.1 fatty acid desaturase [Cystobacter fuscus]
MSESRFFRFSRWDILNVAVIPLHTAIYLTLAYEYKRLSPVALVALIPVLFAMSLQNGGANHNHYHTPFFRARWLNVATSMGFSMGGNPKTIYNLAHGLHHATVGEWNDASVLAILGVKRPLHQQLLAYVTFVFESLGAKYLILLILLKRWPVERLAAFAAPKTPESALHIFKRMQDPTVRRAVMLDVAAWAGFRLVLCLIDWRFFFFYFLPVTYLIGALRQAENYIQHWGATDPSDKKRDSVSCYGTLYNLLTFNLGYHQEHHLRPAVHWLKLPALTAELPADRRIVPLIHYVNLPIFYPEVAAGLAAKRAQGQALTVPEGVVGATGLPNEASSSDPQAPARS